MYQQLNLSFTQSHICQINAKPFLKWAGGKGQLLEDLNKRLPSKILKEEKIDRYIEPFVGGGAFFFFLKSNYFIKEAILIDINKELIVGYKVVQNDVEKLISRLEKIESKFLKLSQEDRKDFFYNVRKKYNDQKKLFNYEKYGSSWIERAAYLIFLNKTCFNGLFRVNSKGEFNVPFGKYKNPTICDTLNLLEANKALKNTKIICADFEESKKYVEKNTFLYLDPPYRPLNSTSYFTSYSENGFDEKDQLRLAQFFRDVDKMGAFLMLSNSDPKVVDEKDNFFDKLYSGFNIERVNAKRTINRDSTKRGTINELIIRNYY